MSVESQDKLREGLSKTVKAKLPMRLENEDGSVTVKLFAPIKYGEEELIKEIRLIRPKAKHVKNVKLQNLSFGDMINLMSKLSGHAPSVLDELDMLDFSELGEVLDTFLGSTAKNGKTD